MLARAVVRHRFGNAAVGNFTARCSPPSHTRASRRRARRRTDIATEAVPCSSAHLSRTTEAPRNASSRHAGLLVFRFFHWGGWTRTNNIPINSRVVCQLTYAPSTCTCTAAHLVQHRGADNLPETKKPAIIWRAASNFRQTRVSQISEWSSDYYCGDWNYSRGSS
jgi:hypothetical protein